MKGVLFLSTHIGSGYDDLFNALDTHPRIDGFKSDMSYDHYDKIEALVSNPHKYNKSNSIWMDLLLHNHSFTCKAIMSICKFVYLMREPRESLSAIIATGQYDAERAARYYRYRLSGLCEYAVRSGGYVLTHDRLKELAGLEVHLGLKHGSLSEIPRAVSLKEAVSLKSETVPAALLEECDRSYEQHLGHLIRAGLLT